MSYESDSLRSIYLLFHYGTRDEVVHGAGFDADVIDRKAFDFPTATVDCFTSETGNASRTLDLGCAVGRSSFELSKTADEVIGIDFSESFIEVAEKIRSGESVEFKRFGEAHLGDDLEVTRPEGSQPDRITFEQGDAMNLRDDLGSFDRVHAANLLCRLPEPMRLIERLPDLVKPGGELVMATPCTWLEEFTPRENQPSGRTFDFLLKHLSGSFDHVVTQEIPFVIREHVRKFQLSTSQTSLWRRKM